MTTDDLAARVRPSGNPKPRSCYVAVRVVRDDDGYNSYCPAIAGVHGQGDGPVEALIDGIQALRVVIESYDELGTSIPWRDPAPPGPNEIDYYVEVFDGSN